MKVLGVICEFNPFHNGHRFLIEKAKKDTGCDAVLAVMSGNFVQRGIPAIADKHTRARVAVENGADLVLELPAAFSVQSAQYFAEKGVKTLGQCQIISTIAFGSEAGDLSVLESVLTHTETDSYHEAVVSKQNRSLAAALAQSADEKALFSPNNILGIEYLRALRCTDQSMTPYTCKRIAVEHDSEKPSKGFASASFLRGEIHLGKSIGDFAPNACYLPPNLSTWESLVLYRLRTISAGELESISGVSEGIHNRILAAGKSAGSYEELVNLIKTKRYTRTRIERILTCAVLGIQKSDLSHDPYLRVLAANQKGLPLIREIQKHTEVIVKTAAASPHPILDIECRADDIYALLLDDKTGLKTYRQSPVILKK